MLKTTYEASAASVVVEHYACEACGFTGRGRVEVVGSAHVTSRALGHDEAAAQRAVDRAYVEGSDGGSLAIELAPCPRCNVRSPRALARWRSEYVVRGYAVVVVLALLGAAALPGARFFMGGLGSMEGAILTAAFGMVLGLALGVLLARTGHFARARGVMDAASHVVVTSEPERPVAPWPAGA